MLVVLKNLSGLNDDIAVFILAYTVRFGLILRIIVGN